MSKSKYQMTRLDWYALGALTLAAIHFVLAILECISDITKWTPHFALAFAFVTIFYLCEEVTKLKKEIRDAKSDQ